MKVKAYITDKDDHKKLCQTDIDIKSLGLNDARDMVYEAIVPTHIYDTLVGSSDMYLSYRDYQKKKTKISNNTKSYTGDIFDNIGCLKRSIKGVKISEILSYIEELSKVIMTNALRVDRGKVKKIFVKFITKDTHEKHPAAHAYMGKNQSTTFQYFIAYEIEEHIPFRGGLHKKYYTYLRIGRKNGDVGFSTGVHDMGHLVPYHMGDKPSTIPSDFKMLEWTQEREDFLCSLEGKFRELNSTLSEHLKDMSNEKLDKLIENKSQLKLIGNQ